MKILITGAGGWLGSELTEKLLESGNYVRAFVLFSSKRLNNLKKKYNELLEVIEGDICNRDDLYKSLEGIEVVYHLAAKVHSLPKNKLDEEEFFKINTEGSRNLFELCVEHNVKRIIFYSSVAIYGESKNIIDINSPKNPITAYSKSKLKAEEIGLKLYKEKKLPITIIEPVTVYGGDDIGNFEKLKKLVNKGFAPKFGNGENKKTVIYYKDLISMTIEIARDKNTLGKVIICGSEVISYNDIIDVLSKGSQKKILVLKISNKLTSVLVNTCNFINLRISKNLSRQISVLASNNNYNIDYCKKFIKCRTNFKEYYYKR